MRSSKLPPVPISIALLGILLTLLSYILVYQYTPLPAPWNDVFLGLVSILAALLAAAAATLLLRQFKPDDPPRQVWFSFALGLWCWAIAECVWYFIYFRDGDVPIPSIPDVFWLLGLLPFAHAIRQQFRLIYGANRSKEWRWFILVLAGMLFGSLLVTVFYHRVGEQANLSWLAAYIEVFYAFADLVLMLAALRFAQIFGRGLWGRAWLGLLAFVVSDITYSWMEFSGIYAMSVESGNPLSLMIDSLYMLAYLLVALACLFQVLLVRYGPTLRPVPDAESQY